MKFPKAWYLAASIVLQGLNVLAFQKYLALSDPDQGIVFFAFTLGAFSLLSSFAPELLFKSDLGKENLGLNAWLSRSLSWFLLLSVPIGIYLCFTHMSDFYSWTMLLLFWFFALAAVLQHTWLAFNATLFDLRYHLWMALLQMAYLLGLLLVALFLPLSAVQLVMFYFGFGVFPVILFVLPKVKFREMRFTIDWKRLAPIFMVIGSGFLSAKLGDFFVKDIAVSRLSMNTFTEWQMISRLSEIWFSGLGPLLSVVLFPILNSSEPPPFFIKLIKPIGLLLAIHIGIGLVALVGADLWLGLFYNRSFESASTSFAIEWTINFFKAFTWIIGFVWIIQKRTVVFMVLEIVSLAYLSIVVYVVPPDTIHLLFWLGSRYILYVLISFCIFWYAKRSAFGQRAVHRT
jgi:hypothetical protein